MNGFATPLLISPCPDGRTWTLEEELVYQSGDQDGGMTIVAPKGMITDFASTPRFLWPIFPPFGKYSQAAVLHDYIYNAPGLDISRKRADAIFLEAMAASGVPGWKRTVMYLGVRLFGRFAYAPRTDGSRQFNEMVKEEG